MTIAMITKLSAGNALRVFLQPPAGASRWRLLRKLSDTFVGAVDVDAALVDEGTESILVDAEGLVNGVTYYYRAFYLVDAVWVPSATASAAPAADYEDVTTDVMTVLRDRLAAGLLVEVQRGTLRHENGSIPLFVAPPEYGQSRWPIVSLHLSSEDPAQRFLGESLTSDDFGGDAWDEPEGWLAKVQIAIVGWSLNADERIELRKALRRIVIANLQVFESYGFVNVEFSQQDMEDFERYASPVYQAMCTFTCMAPVAVLSHAGFVTDVTQQISTSEVP